MKQLTHMKSIFKKVKPKKITKRTLQEGTTLADHCRKIGLIKSKNKAAASRANGKLGGRPKKSEGKTS